MKSKKYLIFTLLTAAALVSPFVVLAENEGKGPTVREERREEKEDKVDKKNFSISGFLKKSLKSQAAKLINAEITAISGSTLTVSFNGKSYTVNTDANTHFQRHFWGKSSLSEFTVGDKVNVQGKFIDDTHTTVLARLVRNLSIQKRYGVFFGTVTVKNADNFVMSTVNRGNQTVYVIATTKFIKRNQTGMTFADLKVNDRVRVRGLWDKTLSKITEVKEVKDFSLPPHPTGTEKEEPTSTPGPSAAPTATPTTAPTSAPSAAPTVTPSPTVTQAPSETPTPFPTI